MEIRYKWKVLSDKGRLKEPTFCTTDGESPLNGWSGYFDTEESAIKRLTELSLDNKTSFSLDSELTLVKFYHAERVF